MKAILRRIALGLCIAALLCLGGLTPVRPAVEEEAAYLAYPLQPTTTTYQYAIATHPSSGDKPLPSTIHLVAGDAASCPTCPFGCVVLTEAPQ